MTFPLPSRITSLFLCTFLFAFLVTAQHLVPLSVPEPDVKALPGHSSQEPTTLKILVCGDSITQGQEFDFTWRYRIWEWFRTNAAAHLAPTLEYVGPYNGTFPSADRPLPLQEGKIEKQGDPRLNDDKQQPQPQSRTWGAYHPTVDPAFVGNHFALYGRPAWQVVDMLEAQIAAYDPDLVVLHLGFNDLAWWGVPPAELVERMAWLIFKARLGMGRWRRGRKEVGVLVADVSSRVLLEGRPDLEGLTREYNALLAAKVDEWTTADSPVLLVRVSEEYDCHVESCPAGFDGLHPNALGDYQIARAYSKVLHEHYHFGSGPVVVPAINTIPGLKNGGWHERSRLDHQPMGMFAAFACLCVLVSIALRRYRRRERGRPREMYTRLH